MDGSSSRRSPTSRSFSATNSRRGRNEGTRMSLEPGFDTQTPSLPSGGGAVDGLGETFTTDLSTGAGSFGVPLDIPNGPNDIAPSLILRYGTAQGNGPFGLGFAVSFPRIVRTTAHGYPDYGGDAGGLTLEG